MTVYKATFDVGFGNPITMHFEVNDDNLIVQAHGSDHYLWSYDLLKKFRGFVGLDLGAIHYIKGLTSITSEETCEKE